MSEFESWSSICMSFRLQYFYIRDSFVDSIRPCNFFHTLLFSRLRWVWPSVHDFLSKLCANYDLRYLFQDTKRYYGPGGRNMNYLLKNECFTLVVETCNMPFFYTPYTVIEIKQVSIIVIGLIIIMEKPRSNEIGKTQPLKKYLQN